MKAVKNIIVAPQPVDPLIAILHLSAFSSPLLHINETPFPLTHVSATPSPRTHVSETPSPLTHVSATPSPRTHVSETPSPLTHVSATPSSQSWGSELFQTSQAPSPHSDKLPASSPKSLSFSSPPQRKSSSLNHSSRSTSQVSPTREPLSSIKDLFPNADSPVFLTQYFPLSSEQNQPANSISPLIFSQQPSPEVHLPNILSLPSPPQTVDENIPNLS